MTATRPGARRMPGFTLVELLVAVSVLAIISVIAWRGLESLVSTRERLEPQADELRTMVAAFGQMEVDFAQAADPQFFSLPSHAVAGGDGGESGLQILRRAPSETGGPVRLQRVIYAVRDGQLVRAASAPVRAAGLLATAEMSPVTLLSGIAGITLRVWKNQGWAEGAAELATSDYNTLLPAGLEVTLVRRDGTRLRKVLVTR